jgi:hypothetical protein
MKFKFLAFLALYSILQSFSPSILGAQEVTDLKLLTNPKDTTWRFCEVTTKDGDTIGLRYFPQAWQKRAAFKDFAYRLAQAEIERKLEFERLSKAVQKNVNYFSAIVDSVGGAGSFSAMQNEGLKTKMQGPWSLVIRGKNAAEPEVMTVNIQGDQLTTKDKTAGITWQTGTKFRLKSGGVFTFLLNFEQVEPDRYVAENTVAGVVTKYILKR